MWYSGSTCVVGCFYLCWKVLGVEGIYPSDIRYVVFQGL